MSLQTIAYGTMRPEENNAFISTHIFPDSELPQPHELLEAASGLFELKLLRNDRAHYARTCDLWYQNLAPSPNRGCSNRRRGEGSTIRGLSAAVGVRFPFRQSRITAAIIGAGRVNFRSLVGRCLQSFDFDLGTADVPCWGRGIAPVGPFPQQHGFLPWRSDRHRKPCERTGGVSLSHSTSIIDLRAVILWDRRSALPGAKIAADLNDAVRRSQCGRIERRHRDRSPRLPAAIDRSPRCHRIRH